LGVLNFVNFAIFGKNREIKNPQNYFHLEAICENKNPLNLDF